MKIKKIILSTGVVAALSIALNSTNHLQSKSQGAPSANTGAPKTTGFETTCARSGCHGSNLNAGPHTIDLTIAGDSENFTPGQTYTLTTKIVGATGTAAGFQMVCLNPNKTNSGFWTIGTETQIVPGSGRSYITHTNRTRKFWTFTWTAPAASLAPDSVTFYFAGLETVGGAYQTYTNSKIFRKKVLTSANGTIVSNDFILFPVPATNELNLSLSDFSISNLVEIFGMDGKSVLSQNLNPGTSVSKIELPVDMKSGHYNLVVQNEKGLRSKRFFKL